ncbi:hypothetical protein ACP70R_034373 [Stipagrostis hirtigluma subsp. patula]
MNLTAVGLMGHQDSQKREPKSVAGADIISNLPDSVKDKILCSLPIKEAVQTCLLSSKWRYTWASMTELRLRDDDFALGNHDEDGYFWAGGVNKLIYFTNKFLFLHNGPILEFQLNSQWGDMLLKGGHIDRWILMLSRKGIKGIQIWANLPWKHKFPSTFFSCDQLEHACLQGCDFQLPPRFKGFKHLHTLHLECFHALGNSIGDLVASCPNLEKLTLSRFHSITDINIKSTKLKTLTVDGTFKHLNLRAPHVTSAAIRLPVYIDTAPRAGRDIKFFQSIGSLSNIENITLLGQAFEITLEIGLGNFKEARAAHCLFQNAPNLQRLRLQLICRGSAIVPASHFWDSIDRQELGFLKLLLEDAPILRKVKIKDNGKLDVESLKHILKMRRTSKDAEVIVL